MVDIKVYTKEWYSLRQKTDIDIALAHREYEKLIAKSPECQSLKKELHFHDSRLTDMRFCGDVLSVSLDISSAASSVKEARFTNARIITNDEISAGDFWIYEELYKASDQYELHVLFCDAADRPKQLVFTFSEVAFSHDREKLARQKALKEKYNLK